MPSPTSNQVHIDQPLTNISLAYRNDEAGYIAEKVFPRVPVRKQSDKYFTYVKADWFRDEMDRRAPGARSVRVDYGISTDSYLAEVYGVAKGIPDEVYDNVDSPLQPLAEATEFLTDKAFIKKEIQVAAIAFGTGWSSSATPSILWDLDTSNPIGDAATAVNTVEQNIGRTPNLGVIGGDLWRHLMQHPDLVDRIKGAAGPGQPAILTESAIAALLGVNSLAIGKAMKENALEGQTSSRARIWGLHALFVYVTGSPALRTPNAGYVFEWNTRQVNRYREEQEHQDVVEVTQSFDVKLVATDAAYFYKNASST